MRHQNTTEGIKFPSRTFHGDQVSASGRVDGHHERAAGDSKVTELDVHIVDGGLFRRVVAGVPSVSVVGDLQLQWSRSRILKG